MRAIRTAIHDALIIEPEVFGDDRGFFMETWNAGRFAELGVEANFVQDNQSRSRRGVLRGLHYQVNRPQGKLVRVATGRVFDAIVDLRRSSPSFGKWIGVELSAKNKRMLWVPPGLGHGFLTLENDTDFLYKCTEFYSPQDERSIRWDDAGIGIVWPLDGLIPVLSAKDLAAMSFANAELYA